VKYIRIDLDVLKPSTMLSSRSQTENEKYRKDNIEEVLIL
jgi:hypothetical protein